MVSKIPFNYYYYIADKYVIQEAFDKMATELTNEQKERLSSYANYREDGSYYYSVPSTNTGEIGATYTPPVVSAEAAAWEQSPEGQEFSRNQLLAATDPANDVREVTATSEAVDGEGLFDDPTPPPKADNTADGFVATNEGVVEESEPYTMSSEEFDGEVGASGSGYDPDNPSYGIQSQGVGGDVAVSENYTGAPSYAGGYAGEATEEGGGGYDPTTAGLDDPKNARLATSGLLPGGANADPATETSVAFQSTNGGDAATSANNDWRVRVSLAENAHIFYKDSNAFMNIMSPLIETNGVIFPYTPSIQVTHAANYSTTPLTHSNYPMQFYTNSEVQDISITGEFTVQSIDEGKYLMAAIYFFRAATKMFFGSGANVGNPPPMVFLDGYGDHYFPHVPCVVASFQHTLTPDVDYIEIPVTTSSLVEVDVQNDNVNIGSVQNAEYVPGLLRGRETGPGQRLKRTQYQNIVTKTRVPTSSSITVTLKPIYSRRNLHQRFDLNKFASGKLLQDNRRGLGGFI